MSTQSKSLMSTVFARCSCGEMYVAAENLMTGEPLWTRPKRKRGGCAHEIEQAQWWDASVREWKMAGG